VDSLYTQEARFAAKSDAPATQIGKKRKPVALLALREVT
jgi:hypothetical protein